MATRSVHAVHVSTNPRKNNNILFDAPPPKKKHSLQANKNTITKYRQITSPLFHLGQSWSSRVESQKAITNAESWLTKLPKMDNDIFFHHNDNVFI